MSNEAELLAAIHAAPDDDEARRVYADALIERGDPRGELIVLQLRRAAGDASARENELERALLKRYASAWLGPIAHLVDASGGLSSAWARSRTRFERGFLATAFLKLMTSPPLADDPIWHTCEELRGYLRPHLDMLVKLPLRALRRLRVTDTFTADDLAQLARRTTPIAVERVPIFINGTPLPSVAHVFPDAEAQFSLGAQWRDDVELLAGCGLRRARLWTGMHNVGALAALFRTRPARFERVVIEVYRGQPTLAEVELVRGPDGRYG